MEEEKSSAWQTIVSGNGTRPLGIFPSGTIELVLCILIREIVKVGRLQWIDCFLSIALKLPARARMLLCSNLFIITSFLWKQNKRSDKQNTRLGEILQFEVFRKNDSMVCICSLLQWEPRGECLLGCALQEMGKQQDAPSLQGTQSLLRCERLHWTQFLEILCDTIKKMVWQHKLAVWWKCGSAITSCRVPRLCDFPTSETGAGTHFIRCFNMQILPGVRTKAWNVNIGEGF